MIRRTKQAAPPPRVTIRCAIYTRKSTEEGLEQEFNTLHAQRDAGEAYIKSQTQEGWVCLPDNYDDGGFTGANMERPALKRLLADIEAGKVDCVIVYKVDRLSRSLLDFAKIIEKFDRHKVSFVSVTQQFNTATSMGRLILNVLLSFAQFERELISERTRDKMAAARRKGKRTGGQPLLGYNIDPKNKQLVANHSEAARVRETFELYLEHEAMLPVVEELARRNWRNKVWRTRRGKDRGGKLFTRTSLYKLLTNITYVGKVTYKDQVFDGVHQAIVPLETWQRVQAILGRNARSGGAMVRNSQGALLKGLLRCVPCDSAMTFTFSSKDKARRYHYYVCSSAQKRGWDTCPSKSVPAWEMEQVVVDQIRAIGRDPGLFRKVVNQWKRLTEEAIAELEREEQHVSRDLGKWHREVKDLVSQPNESDVRVPVATQLADLHDRIRCAERRMAEISQELTEVQSRRLDENELKQVLVDFDPLWETLTTQKRVRVIHELVQRVDYDGGAGKVSVTFHPDGFKAIAAGLAAEENATC